MHIYAAGLYRQSLNPKSGDILYLQPGAVFFGSLNIWQVDNVKVMGRGTIVYDGPQDPNADEGWMHKRDWHCIVTDNAHNIEIDGLTCIVRSRTWSIQMKDSAQLTYDDLRVIGGNPGNANQDGMDWVGSTNGLVRNSFFRASDDVIALMGNWDGYTDADLVRPGKSVHDIVVENSELSTSISNVVRAGWPKKIFNSLEFHIEEFRRAPRRHRRLRTDVRPDWLLGSARFARRSQQLHFRKCIHGQLVLAFADGAGRPQPAQFHLPQHLGARPAAPGRIQRCRAVFPARCSTT